jgi:nitroreductase
MSDSDMCSHHGDPDSSGGTYPNETMKLLFERASCRSFSDQKVPAEIMKQILGAGIHAATGGNLQPYSIIKTEKKEACEKLAELCGGQPWIADAPVNLLFCIDYHRLERWAGLEVAPYSARNSFRHFWTGIQDTVIAAQNICTAADSLGLGSVYIGSLLECLRQLRDMLELPDGVFPLVLLSLGYPKTRAQPRKKLGVKVIVHDEKYVELDDLALLDAFERKYPQSKREIKEDRMERIVAVCRNVRGEDFARRCLEKINSQGYISVAHNYFGLHYVADGMPDGNEEFMSIAEEFGLGWFKKFRYTGESES